VRTTAKLHRPGCRSDAVSSAIAPWEIWGDVREISEGDVREI